MGLIFTCSLCRREIESQSTESEAIAKAEAYFGHLPPEERVPLCDDCFEKFMVWWRKQEPGRALQ